MTNHCTWPEALYALSLVKGGTDVRPAAWPQYRAVMETLCAQAWREGARGVASITVSQRDLGGLLGKHRHRSARTSLRRLVELDILQVEWAGNAGAKSQGNAGTVFWVRHWTHWRVEWTIPRADAEDRLAVFLAPMIAEGREACARVAATEARAPRKIAIEFSQFVENEVRSRIARAQPTAAARARLATNRRVSATRPPAPRRKNDGGARAQSAHRNAANSAPSPLSTDLDLDLSTATNSGGYRGERAEADEKTQRLAEAVERRTGVKVFKESDPWKRLRQVAAQCNGRLDELVRLAGSEDSPAFMLDMADWLEGILAGRIPSPEIAVLTRRRDNLQRRIAQCEFMIEQRIADGYDVADERREIDDLRAELRQVEQSLSTPLGTMAP